MQKRKKLGQGKRGRERDKGSEKGGGRKAAETAPREWMKGRRRRDEEM